MPRSLRARAYFRFITNQAAMLRPMSWSTTIIPKTVSPETLMKQDRCLRAKVQIPSSQTQDEAEAPTDLPQISTIC